ncbi:MAG: NADH-quinone oxidoreductase subunit J [Anaerolineales bacterium]|jgi:NADH-quinone oxidoreductase subunit J
MDANLIVFIVMAVVAIGSALGMLLNRNAIYSALFLILNFATVAVFYIILGAPFIAMTQVTVYAGAIMVLFLFVIMLLGAEELTGITTKFDWQRPAAVVLALLMLAELVVVIFFRDTVFGELMQLTDFGTPENIGRVLFNDYLLPFEITAILLLAAMVGAIVIARRVRRKPGQ